MAAPDCLSREALPVGPLAGVETEPRHVEQGSRRVRDILLDEAAAMAADLLIIGAYSHSRMRQVVFGGVTEHMLDHAELPVLMIG